MSDEYHLDYETFSSVNLKKLGGYRYANGEDTEILMFAIAKNDEDPVLWTNPRYIPSITNHIAASLFCDAINDPNALIYAHNAAFEIAITKYRLEKDVGIAVLPDLRKWRCTASMARKAALPHSLEKCAQALELEAQKDKRGEQLIKKFSIPNRGKRIMPQDEASEFQEFCDYCLQDVRVEREIHKELSVFELKDLDLETFHLYNQINDRGLPVDVDTLKKAAEIVQQAEKEMGQVFESIVGFRYTQREKVLNWLQEEGCYPFDNLQAATVTEALEDSGWCSEPDVIHALMLRQKLSFAAFKKIETMLLSVCDDGRVRGSLFWYGAHTGRGAGRVIQPQNFKRPTIKNTDEVYAELKAGNLTVENILKYGSPLEVISSCIRHFIHSEPNCEFNDADYAAIEARIVAWLAGQEDVLEEYRQGIDTYIRMACVIFNCSEEDQIRRKENGESTLERFVGKQAVLGCGFQMWVPSFLNTCNNYGFTIPKEQVMAYLSAAGLPMTSYELAEDSIKEELGKTAVLAYREKHHKIVDLWTLVEEAAVAAVSQKGAVFTAGPKLRFQCVTVGIHDYLLMQLPSGRCIVYPRPQLVQGKRNKLQLEYWAQIPGKSIWGWVSTYGGKLVENATQGTAADIMGYGSCVAEAAGHEIVTLIHDEAISQCNNPSDQRLNDFCEKLSTLPDWAAGLPIVAEGYRTQYYKK